MRRLAARLPWSLIAAVGVLAVAASAAYARPPASVTNATTGVDDAPSLSVRDACSTRTAGQAACMAQLLTIRRTRTLVHPRLRRPAPPERVVRPRLRTADGGRPAEVAAAAAPQPGTPAYLQQAYDLSYLSQTAGAGQTIAIVDSYDDPNAEGDLATYRSEFSLPPCTTEDGCFEKVDQDGGSDYPSCPAGAQTECAGWAEEISLDLDAVSALCPNCHILLVEADSPSIFDLAEGESQAVQLGAEVISDSWGAAVDDWDGELMFGNGSEYSFPDVATVAASGDDGYQVDTDQFPAALPGVIAAGGTSLSPASAGGAESARGFSESAWSGTGSGCDLTEAKPAWQPDGGCAGRAYNDLSADADPDTGMQVYDSAAGGWLVAGGTSEATPLIAAYEALVGAYSQGPAWAYQNASQLNDPSTGSNGSCAASISFICNAGPGYDGPTGAGSISGAVVGGAPGIGGPGTSGAYTVSVGSSDAQLQGGVYPNGAQTTYWWEYGTTTAYGEQTAAESIGTGTAPVSVSGSLTDLEPSTAYHYRLVAQNRFGTEYGYDFTLETSQAPAVTPITPPPSASSTTNASLPPSATTSTSPSPSETTASPAASATSEAPRTATSDPQRTTDKTLSVAPTVTHLRALSVGAGTATVRATIETHGARTTYSLQYGTTQTLRVRAIGTLLSSRPRATISWKLRGLSPGRVYYFRVLASSARGAGHTAVAVFRTSRITIVRVVTRDRWLRVLLRCHGTNPCQARVALRRDGRVIASADAGIRGNRQAAVALKLTDLVELLSRARDKPEADLSVSSVWARCPATVSAMIRFRGG